MVVTRKKLIEVALPLEAINRESAREKSIRQGHPSTFHIWWARRPLAASRGVLFACLIDDPSSHPENFPTEEDQCKERQRLFNIIERLVRWESTTNEELLREARSEIAKSCRDNPPIVLDPFCGGGSIPLEAQRLGLEVHASDLNPVAVLITKALVEIPPKFEGMPPVNPKGQRRLDSSRRYHGAQGLAEDLRYYGEWIKTEAYRLIGPNYPKVRLGQERGGVQAPVIAWLWARIVTCPNPACRAQMPLLRSFSLSTKKGKEAWVNPIVNRQAKTLRFEVREGKGKPPDSPKLGRGAKFRCLVCEQVVEDRHIKDEGLAGRMKAQLMAIVAEGEPGQVYLAPSDEQEQAARVERPRDVPSEPLGVDPRNIWCVSYGLNSFDKLFTARQLKALATFSDLVEKARNQILADANRSDDGISLDGGGTGITAYADALATYLALAVGRCANYWSSLTMWGGGFIVQTFGRQALPMVWDFSEVNPFSDSTGNWMGAIEWIAGCLEISVPASGKAYVKQLDATSAINGVEKPLVFTDPPYYDNISYADLSDFFYVWLRRTIRRIYPQLFSTLLTPKDQELIASPYRHITDNVKPEQFFEEGLARVFHQIHTFQHSDYPFVLYYAFKQAESERNGEEASSGASFASTGWETMLEALMRSRFAITGTWPLRTERDQGLKTGTNVLASSIVLSCRGRSSNAPLSTRREFLSSLKSELPLAVRELKQGNIAPVDLAQAAIGPGMAIFSNYEKVIEADGKQMSVRTALALINQTLDEVLAEQESDFDADTRWALAWFEQFAMGKGPYGTAETLSKAKNTSVARLAEAQILRSAAGEVHLLKRTELNKNWDATQDSRLSIWVVAQHLIRTLESEGELPAAQLLQRIGSVGEIARDLAYRLYSICERKKWADEALMYNALVVAWPEITRLAKSVQPSPQQARLNL